MARISERRWRREDRRAVDAALRNDEQIRVDMPLSVFVAIMRDVHKWAPGREYEATARMELHLGADSKWELAEEHGERVLRMRYPE